MKKALIWTGIGTVVFIVLVGAIFVVLTMLQPKDDPAAAIELTNEDGTVKPEILLQKEAEIDTLNAQIAQIKGELFNTMLTNDSLRENKIFMTGLVDEYQKSIDQLNTELLKKQNQKSRIKDLAKTYESMKADEIRPILKNVDDKTVIALYENMSSRSRKVILNSLSSDRAALITQQLAGNDTDDEKP